jgi:hypothetical protein
MSKETGGYWRLLEPGEPIQEGDQWRDETFGRVTWKPAQLFGCSTEDGIYRRRITTPDWPTPIAFVDEKPTEGQSILYRQKDSKGWNHAEYTERYYDLNSVTHWLPAPPDLPEPKPAWEVAWDALDKSCMTHDTRYTFMLGFKAAQKEKA